MPILLFMGVSFINSAMHEANKTNAVAGEVNEDGLVLLKNTISTQQSQFGGSITGIVENRRAYKVSYAQISFPLYDEYGAKVGTARANINDLEAGGVWKFNATTFGARFSSFGTGEITGF